MKNTQKSKFLSGLLVAVFALLFIFLYLKFSGTGELQEPQGQSTEASYTSLSIYDSGEPATTPDNSGGASPAEDESQATGESDSQSGLTASEEPDGGVSNSPQQGSSDSNPDYSRVYDEGSQFRNSKRLQEHYDKHVIDQAEFGDITIEEYLYLAQCLVDRPGEGVLTKVKDGDTYFYDPATNEFAVVADDGYIRTFFKPSAGQAYYDRQ